VVSSVKRPFLLLCRRFLISYSPICLSFFLVACLLEFYWRSPCLPINISSRVFPALSCTNFRVLGLMLRSLIDFELILLQGDRHGSSFSSL
jgi:hypothetical protein